MKLMALKITACSTLSIELNILMHSWSWHLTQWYLNLRHSRLGDVSEPSDVTSWNELHLFDAHQKHILLLLPAKRLRKHRPKKHWQKDGWGKRITKEPMPVGYSHWFTSFNRWTTLIWFEDMVRGQPFFLSVDDERANLGIMLTCSFPAVTLYTPSYLVVMQGWLTKWSNTKTWWCFNLSQKNTSKRMAKWSRCGELSKKDPNLDGQQSRQNWKFPLILRYSSYPKISKKYPDIFTEEKHCCSLNTEAADWRLADASTTAGCRSTSWTEKKRSWQTKKHKQFNYIVYSTSWI